MITRTRALIISETEYQLSHLEKFEAITVIQSFEQSVLEEVWKNNKTPAVSKEKVGNCTSINFFYMGDMLNNNVINEQQKEEFQDRCHEAGFETGDYITGQVYDTFQERCVLCEIANYRGMKNSLVYYNSHVEKEVDVIIYESENFYVTSELGAFAQGFLMIVPKKHYLSVAQFEKTILDEYKQVCIDVEKLLKGTFGKGKTVIFFEKGSNPSGLSHYKNSMVHAHTHVVIGHTMEDKYLQMVDVKPVEDIRKAKHIAYFSYQEDCKGQLYVSMSPDVYIQRQYGRQVLAEEMGFAPGQYNWRKVDFSENTKATLYRLYMHLKNNKNVCCRIKKRTQAFIEGYEKREDFRRA